MYLQKRAILTFLTVGLMSIANAQIPTLDWVKAFGSTGTDRAEDMVKDAAGNLYVAGAFTGTVDFDPGAGVVNLVSTGGFDGYIVKLDANGNYAWSFRLGDTGTQSASEIAVDASGNVYAVGSFTGTVDFDPGAGVSSYTATASGQDLFILKLDASGNFSWAKRIGGTNNELIGGLAIGAAGELVLAGGFESTVDFNPDNTVTENRSSAGLYDIFILRLTTNGDFISVGHMSGAGSDFASGLGFDPSGNILLTGDFQVTTDFDPGAGISTIAAGTMGDNGFVVKLTPTGNFIWAFQFGGNGSDRGNSVASDADGDIYITGSFAGTADFDPGAGTTNRITNGGYDAFVAKYTSGGALVWVKSYGGSNSDYGNVVNVDANENVYVGGHFLGTTDLDPGTGTYSIASAGQDLYFLKLDAAGNLVSASSSGNNATNYISSSILVSPGVIYYAANFSGTVDLAPGSTVSNVTSAGGEDFAIFKISESASPGPSITNFSPASGMTGITVTITGQNFSSIAANNTVEFNGTTATVSASSLSSMTVVVPFGASTGPIKVTVGGVAATSTTDFTVIPTPVINVTSQPADLALCPEGNGSLSVAAAGASNMTYRWQKLNTVSGLFENLIESSSYNGVSSASLTIDLNSGATVGSYRAAVNGDFAAEVFTNTVVVSQITPPANPVASSVAVSGGCGPVTVQLSATAPVAGEFRWYSPQNLNFPFYTSSNGNFTTPTLSGASSYFVSIFDGVCESGQTQINASVNYEGPGAKDNAFQPPANGLGSITFIDHVLLQTDKKIVVNGYEIGGIEYMVYRLNSDGTPDAAFTALEESLFNGRVDNIALQSDGKIVIGGRFTDIDGTSYGRIARLNSDGSVDATFNVSGIGFNSRVNGLYVLPDDKILVAGNFTTFNGTSARYFIRLNANGSLDATFNTGSGPSNSVRAFTVLNDGRILISGIFTSYNGTATPYFARLASNGAIDNTFTPPGEAIAAISLVEQPDGKILVGGNFTTVGGLSRENLARLNANGSVDSSFDPGTGFNDAVYAIYLTQEGKIVVGGWFENVNGENQNFITRLNPNGERDKFFDAGIGPFSLVTEIVPYGVDKILVGGYIDSWNGNLQNGLAVVNNACIRTPVASNASTCTGSVVLSACGGVDGQYRWYTQMVGGTAIAGEVNSTLSITNLTTTTTYYVTLKDDLCESARVPVTATVGSGLAAPSVTASSGCTAQSQTLSASGGAANSYRWYTTLSGGSPISGATGETFVTPALTTTTTYYVSVTSGGCESNRVPVVATVSVPATPTVAAINPVCVGESAILSASGAANGSFRWYRADKTLIVGETNATFATGTLATAQSYYVSTVANGCESQQVLVSVAVKTCVTNAAPVITSTSVETQIGGLVTLDLESLIQDPDNNADLSTLTIVVQPSSGANASIENGILTLDYSGKNFSGKDQLTIRVCDALNVCSESIIFIDVLGDIIVYNAISPNGDGVNDFLRIEYIDVIEETKKNLVRIFNRWGDEVFVVRNYDNAANNFKGLNKNGNELPTGTYFFLIQYSSGRKEENGYLHLKR